MFSSVYGQEHLEERAGDMEFMDDLHGAYGELFTPTFLMPVWDEMTFEYNIILGESIRRILQALPKSARRDRIEGRALHPINGGPSVW